MTPYLLRNQGEILDFSSHPHTDQSQILLDTANTFLIFSVSTVAGLIQTLLISYLDGYYHILSTFPSVSNLPSTLLSVIFL